MCHATDLRNVPLESLQGQDHGSSHCPVVIPGRNERDGNITTSWSCEGCFQVTILQHGQKALTHCLGWSHSPTGCSCRDKARGAGHSLLVDQDHQVGVIKEPWILSKLLVGDDVLHELLWWDRGCHTTGVHNGFQDSRLPSFPSHLPREICLLPPRPPHSDRAIAGITSEPESVGFSAGTSDGSRTQEGMLGSVTGFEVCSTSLSAREGTAATSGNSFRHGPGVRAQGGLSLLTGVPHTSWANRKPPAPHPG